MMMGTIHRYDAAARHALNRQICDGLRSCAASRAFPTRKVVGYLRCGSR
jgi:hypothetical protein